jgi:hypothetical protein
MAKRYQRDNEKSSILSLWYLLIIPLISSHYPFGIWSLFLWYLLIIHLVSSHYPFDIFSLSLWHLLIIPLISSHYTFVIFSLSLWYLLIIPLVSVGHCVVCLLRLTTSHYPFGIFWPLYCLSSSTDHFSLSLWYLLAIVVSLFFDWRLLIIPLISFGHCIVCLIRLTTSHYPFGICWPLCCLSSSIDDFSLSLWYLLAIVLSVFFDWRLLIIPLVSFGNWIVCLLRFTTSHYPFGIFWPLYCLSSSTDISKG